MNTADTNRLLRIESKLTRFMLAMGMDSDGNPDQLLVLDKPTTEQFVAIFDQIMGYFDALPNDAYTDEVDRIYRQVEQAYNRATSVWAMRWKQRLPVAQDEGVELDDY